MLGLLYKLSSSLGACIATAASRRRSLAAPTYDVSVFLSESEVDDATLTDAENSLKAEGVTRVETSDPIDPIAELETPNSKRSAVWTRIALRSMDWASSIMQFSRLAIAVIRRIVATNTRHTWQH